VEDEEEKDEEEGVRSCGCCCFCKARRKRARAEVRREGVGEVRKEGRRHSLAKACSTSKGRERRVMCSLRMSAGRTRVGSSSFPPSLPEKEGGWEEDAWEEGREDEEAEEGEEEEARMRTSRRRAVTWRLWKRGVREGSFEEEEEEEVKEERRCLALVIWER